MKHKYDINSLFANARQAKALISIQEIEGMLDMTYSGRVKGKNKLFTPKKLIIMTALISITITAVIFSINTTTITPAKIKTTPIAPPDTPRQKVIKDLGPVVSNPNVPHHPISPFDDKPLDAITPPDGVMPPAIIINSPGINLLQLNSDALRKLGVLTGKHGVSVPGPTSDGTPYLTYSALGTIDGIYKKLAQELNLSQQDIKDYNAMASKLPYPLLITEDLGQNWRAYQGIGGEGNMSKIFAEIQAKINTMIPILVRTGNIYTLEDSLNNRWRHDVILWYEATPEFLALLPKKNAHDIEEEKNVIFAALETQQRDTTYNAPEKGVQTTVEEPGCKYFETCKAVGSSISSSLVYPNPTDGQFTLAVELADARIVTIHLADIGGKTAVSLHTKQPQQAGTTEYACDISGLNSGVYLLMIETQKGERTTQRIIKK